MLVYRVSADGATEKLATFDRAGVPTLARLKERLPDLLLVLVPRHPERFQAVARLCRTRGHGVALRSRTPAMTAFSIHEFPPSVVLKTPRSPPSFHNGPWAVM